jgi:hypothetical protein
MELMALIEDMLIKREKKKEWVSQYGIMGRSNMESIIRVNFMVLLGPSLQMGVATGVSSNIISTMAMAHFIGLMDTHTQGSRKIIREMAMVLIHGVLEKFVTDSIKMINGKDMDSTSAWMATSMMASGKITRDQAWG